MTVGTPRAAVEASAAPWGTRLLGVFRTRWLRHNIVVALGVVIAGVLGFAFQSMGSHLLSPAKYGGAFAVLAVVAVLGPAVSPFGLLLSRATSAGIAQGDRRASSSLLVSARRRLLLAGAAITALMCLASPLVAGFLRVQLAWVLVGALATAFQVATPPLMGTLQGEQRFYWITSLWIGQALVKLAAGFLLGLLFGGIGLIAGVVAGGAANHLAARLLARPQADPHRPPPDWGGAAAYIARVAPATLAMSLLLSTDVVMARHFLPARAAGEYSAVAVLGRAIYWAALGMSAALFPKVVAWDHQRRNTGTLVTATVAFAVLGGLAGLVILSLVGSWLLTAFAGPEYAPGAAYLAWYGLGMTLLGGSMILVTTQQSRGRIGFLWVLLPLTVIEPAVIFFLRHSNPFDVVQVVVACFASLFLGLLVTYMLGRSAPAAAPLT